LAIPIRPFGVSNIEPIDGKVAAVKATDLLAPKYDFRICIQIYGWSCR